MVDFSGSGQTVLPDRSFLKEQKLVENAKIEKCDILSNFKQYDLYFTFWRSF